MLLVCYCHIVYGKLVTTDVGHQYVAIYAGTFFGLLTVIGAFLLFKRRVSNERIKATSRSRDTFIILWIMFNGNNGLKYYFWLIPPRPKW